MEGKILNVANPWFKFSLTGEATNPPNSKATHRRAGYVVCWLLVMCLVCVPIQVFLGLVSNDCVECKDESIDYGEWAHGQGARDGVVGGCPAGQGGFRRTEPVPSPNGLDAQSEVAARADEVPPL